VLWPVFCLALFVAVPGRQQLHTQTKKTTDTMRSPTVTRTRVGLNPTHEADLQREHFIFGSKMWQFKQCFFRKAAASLEMFADDVPAEENG
jgi:hypothetical protein